MLINPSRQGTGKSGRIPSAWFALLAAMLCPLLPRADAQAAMTPSALNAPPAADAPALPIAVSSQNPNIRYIGRFDTRQPAGPRCAWSASRVEIRFFGSGLNAVLSDTGSDAYEVVVDGTQAPVLTLHPGTAVYSLLRKTRPQAAARIHTVVLVKRTEPMVGTTQFLGFQLPVGGRLLTPPARLARRLEVIGDSISCGYGNEGKDQNEHFTPATENAFLSYGALTARALGAEYFCVAWSGRTMSPTNTMPAIYGLTLPEDTSSVWDFKKWVPDVVVINLGTNDFGRSNPDRAAWVAAYEQFLDRVRKNYPQAVIYCASGPMMSDSWPPGHLALTTLNSYLSQIVADEQRAGDKKVLQLAFTPQTAQDGYGADWHPSLKTHAAMAATLENAVGSRLAWTPGAGRVVKN